MSTVKQDGAADHAAHDFSQCEYWGQGGQYVYDPATGRRTRVGDLPAEPGAVASGDLVALPDSSVSASSDSGQAVAADGVTAAAEDTIITATKGKNRG